MTDPTGLTIQTDLTGLTNSKTDQTIPTVSSDLKF